MVDSNPGAPTESPEVVMIFFSAHAFSVGLPDREVTGLRSGGLRVLGACDEEDRVLLSRLWWTRTLRLPDSIHFKGEFIYSKGNRTVRGKSDSLPP